MISKTIISEQISKRHLVCERQLHCADVLITQYFHYVSNKSTNQMQQLLKFIT
jgi:hypothetical protein